MPTQQDSSRPCMAIADRNLTLDQVQASMKAMMDQAQATSETPACTAIVDASGNMEAFAKMDNARVLTRRHAERKAYTAAILGINSGDWVRTCPISARVSARTASP